MAHVEESFTAYKRQKARQESRTPRKTAQEPGNIQIVEDEDDLPDLPLPQDAAGIQALSRALPAISPARRRDLVQTPSPVGSPSNTSLLPHQGDDSSSMNAQIRSISEGEAVANDFRAVRLHEPQSPSSPHLSQTSPRRPLPQKRPSTSALPEGDARATKIPGRHRSGPDPIFQRGPGPSGPQPRLFDPGGDNSAQLRSSKSMKPNVAHASSGEAPSPRALQAQQQNKTLTADQRSDPSSPEALQFKQPNTKPITQEQLINEVKGIYAGLVMVEKKCVEIDQQQGCSTNKLSSEQYQALIALHRTLLHEHHDFFLASQHPSASPALKKLATKYAMPARMWRHGIHSFLELLRHRLPDSLEHMLAFVYLAYSMMALLLESVPSFEDTWIECLGDLARYRMAIEESDVKDRENWSDVARMWYNRAADKSPGVGRIQHHLAVLARPNIVRQLFYYSKALVTVTPFYNARESVMLLFNQFLEPKETASQRYLMVESAFVKANGLLFVRGFVKEFDNLVEDFIAILNTHIRKIWFKSPSQGPEMASAICAAMFDFGHDEAYLVRRFVEQSARTVPASAETPTAAATQLAEDTATRLANMLDYWTGHGHRQPVQSEFQSENPTSPGDSKFSGSGAVSGRALTLFGSTIEVAFSQEHEEKILPCVLPFAHVVLAVLYSLAFVPGALEYVQRYVPWEKVAHLLTKLHENGGVRAQKPEIGKATVARQLPEDYVMRGLLWAQYYYPDGYFSDHRPEEERTLEMPSHQLYRAERCLWLGDQLCSLNHWLEYEPETKQFLATDFGKSVGYGARDFSDSRSMTEPLEQDPKP